MIFVDSYAPTVIVLLGDEKFTRSSRTSQLELLIMLWITPAMKACLASMGLR